MQDDECVDSWEDFAVKVKQECKTLVPPSLVLSGENGVLELQYIRVPIDDREQGHGTAMLRRVLAEADRRGVTTVCTPTDERGADMERLERWYERHGFTRSHHWTGHTWARPPYPQPES